MVGEWLGDAVALPFRFFTVFAGNRPTARAAAGGAVAVDVGAG